MRGSHTIAGFHQPLTYVATFLLQLQPVQALYRYISDPNDPITRNISSSCGGDDQANFQVGRCPALLRCVLDGIPSDIAAGFQSGSNIASLVPTILTLIGAGPMELVQMALLSPHRALATCCFSIGLPAGLFRQLRPSGHGFSERIEEAPKQREWIFGIPTTGTAPRWAWRNALVRVVIDIVILILASVMLWFNWQVNTRSMVTWRCEYGWLLFAWPLACMGWLLVAMLLLGIMTEKLEIKYKTRGSALPDCDLKLLQFMMLPYLSDRRLAHLEETHHALPLRHQKAEKPAITTKGPSVSMPVPSSDQNLIARKPVAVEALGKPPRTPSPDARSHHSDTGSGRYGPVNSSAVVVRITMPSETGLRSWRWYEAILEALAVGIYLYATFVLTSTQFLSGFTALTFAAIMAICMSAVRILGNIF